MNRIKFFLTILLAQIIFSFSTSAQQKQFKALLVTTTKGWHHESLHAGVLAIQQLGVRNFFDVTLMENPNGFTDKALEQYQVVIFLNTTGDIFDTAQQRVMERFIRSGKGFVGIHSASDTEYDWEWYTKMVGRMFNIHPAVQTAKLKVLDPKFPGLRDLDGKLWTDEWYDFSPEKTSGLNYILSVDESTYNAKVSWGAKKAMAWGKCILLPGTMIMMEVVPFIQGLVISRLFLASRLSWLICMQAFFMHLPGRNKFN